jgi:hypothetical protein
MKYEWKSISKISLIITLYLCISSLISFFFFSNGMIQTISHITDKNGLLQIILFLNLFVFILLYALSLLASFIAFLIYAAIHFYQSMYASKGYLTHTLPINSNQLFLGKVVIHSIWASVIYLLMNVGFTLFAFHFVNLTLETVPVSEFIAESFAKSPLDYFAFILSGCLSCFFQITILFGAITLGQLFNKHKLGISFLLYTGTLFIRFYLAEIVSRILGQDGHLFQVGISLSVGLIIAAVYYLLSTRAIQKKLSLE